MGSEMCIRDSLPSFSGSGQFNLLQDRGTHLSQPAGLIKLLWGQSKGIFSLFDSMAAWAVRDWDMVDNIRRILLVDDEETFLTTVQRHLKRHGFFIETAVNGLEARRHIEASSETAPFDLVISDVVMPGMDGISLLNWIKRDRPETSVILLTGFGDGDLAVETVRPNIDTYGSKPITPDALMELIHQVAGYRREMLDELA